MSKLSTATIERFTESLRSFSAEFLLVCYSGRGFSRISSSFEGAIGFFDWRLHGQISKLLKRGLLPRGSIGMVVAPNLVGGATVLVFHDDESESSTQRIVETLKKLNAKSVALVESSFSEKQIQPLTKRLTKANMAVSSFAEVAE